MTTPQIWRGEGKVWRQRKSAVLFNSISFWNFIHKFVCCFISLNDMWTIFTIPRISCGSLLAMGVFPVLQVTFGFLSKLRISLCVALRPHWNALSVTLPCKILNKLKLTRCFRVFLFFCEFFVCFRTNAVRTLMLLDKCVFCVSYLLYDICMRVWYADRFFIRCSRLPLNQKTRDVL